MKRREHGKTRERVVIRKRALSCNLADWAAVDLLLAQFLTRSLLTHVSLTEHHSEFGLPVAAAAVPGAPPASAGSPPPR